MNDNDTNNKDKFETVDQKDNHDTGSASGSMCEVTKTYTHNDWHLGNIIDIGT